MIISTGMRTDIPAFYSSWMANRLREGYVLVRNPYNRSSVTRYRLSPDVVDVITFCSKNPAPMLKYLPLLEDYGQYWFVSITPYQKDYEPNVPHISKSIDTFIRLSEAVGKDSVGWRYDPVITDDKYTLEYHTASFAEMAYRMASYTDVCVVSFVDLYPKVKRNCPMMTPVDHSDRIELIKRFVEIGRDYNITIKTCCEGHLCDVYGADSTGCFTKEVYEKAIGKTLRIPNGIKNQREGCSCILGHDIGEYDTCPHMCTYCYANTDKATVKTNLMKHDPHSPFLIGGEENGDVIRNAVQESWADKQISLF